MLDQACANYAFHACRFEAEVSRTWDQVTRDRNVGWRLDYFFVSPDLRDKVLVAEIHGDIMGSDYCPVSLTLDL